jgi:hypothetical protein
VARERDLCDVKIKITEYFDQDEYTEQVGHRPPGAEAEATSSMAAHQQSASLDQNQQFFGQTQMMQRDVNGWDIPPNLAQFTAGPGPAPPPRPPPKKYYTFQRVNGNGGNGKGDGVAGPHKHTLEESDRVKKNSVVRWLAKCEKDDRKKSQVSFSNLSFSISIALKASTSCAYLAVIISRLQSLLRLLWPLSDEEIVAEAHDVCMERRHTTAPAGSGVADHLHNVILMLTRNRTLHWLYLLPSCSYSLVISMYIITQVMHRTSRSFSLPGLLPILKSLKHQHFLPSSTSPRISWALGSVRFNMTDTNQGGDPSKKTYHKKATGNALTTVKNHSKEDDLKLYGSAFWYVHSPRFSLFLNHRYPFSLSPTNPTQSLRPTRVDLP